MEKEGLGAYSINGLRGTLFTVFSRARKAKKWTGQNPVIDVESRRLPKKVYVTLKPEEAPLLLAEAPDDWRDLFARALYTAMRKGPRRQLLFPFGDNYFSRSVELTSSS
jgi:hypothetical protein